MLELPLLLLLHCGKVTLAHPLSLPIPSVNLSIPTSRLLHAFGMHQTAIGKIPCAILVSNPTAKVARVATLMLRPLGDRATLPRSPLDGVGCSKIRDRSSEASFGGVGGPSS
ncbi:hypothetical protein V8F06_010628 [Rhypophila decipiens]